MAISFDYLLMLLVSITFALLYRIADWDAGVAEEAPTPVPSMENGADAFPTTALIVKPLLSACLYVAEIHSNAFQAGALGSGFTAVMGEFATYYWMGMTLWIYAMPMLLDTIGCLLHICPWFHITFLCIFAWAVLWAIQFPLWLSLFTTRIPLVIQLYVWLISLIHPFVLQSTIGSVHAASLPSERLRELYKKVQPALSRLSRESSLGMFGYRCFEWTLLLAYIATRKTAFLQERIVELSLASIMLGLDTSKIVLGKMLYSDQGQRHAWTLQYTGFYSSSALLGSSSECDDEDVCGVCLDSMCSPIQDVPEVSRLARRRRGPGLSICRLQRLYPCQSSGISAIRSARHEDGAGHASLPWINRVATLSCGHQFHALCMRKCALTAVRKRICPICRAEYALGDPTDEIEDILVEDEGLLDFTQPFIVGFGVLIVFVASSFFPWLRPSTFKRSALVVFLTMGISIVLELTGYLDLIDGFAGDIDDSEFDEVHVT